MLLAYTPIHRQFHAPFPLHIEPMASHTCFTTPASPTCVLITATNASMAPASAANTRCRSDSTISGTATATMRNQHSNTIQIKQHLKQQQQQSANWLARPKPVRSTLHQLHTSASARRQLHNACFNMSAQPPTCALITATSDSMQNMKHNCASTHRYPCISSPWQNMFQTSR